MIQFLAMLTIFWLSFGGKMAEIGDFHLLSALLIPQATSNEIYIDKVSLQKWFDFWLWWPNSALRWSQSFKVFAMSTVGLRRLRGVTPIRCLDLLVSVCVSGTSGEGAAFIGGGGGGRGFGGRGGRGGGRGGGGGGGGGGRGGGYKREFRDAMETKQVIDDLLKDNVSSGSGTE